MTLRGKALARWAWYVTLFVGLAVVGAAPAHAERYVPAKILKVLPHYLDLNGKHSLSPSLFERDAYQAELRRSRDKVSGMRFDILCRTSVEGGEVWKVRLELRPADSGGAEGDEVKPLIETVDVKRRGRAWVRVVVNGERYRRLGGIAAWRAVLIRGDREMAETRSFFW